MNNLNLQSYFKVFQEFIELLHLHSAQDSKTNADKLQSQWLCFHLDIRQVLINYIVQHILFRYFLIYIFPQRLFYSYLFSRL